MDIGREWKRRSAAHPGSAERVDVPGGVDAHAVGALEELDPVGAHHPGEPDPIEVGVRRLHLHTNTIAQAASATYNEGGRERHNAVLGNHLVRVGLVLLRRVEEPERRRLILLHGRGSGLLHRHRRRVTEARAADVRGRGEEEAASKRE